MKIGQTISAFVAAAALTVPSFGAAGGQTPAQGQQQLQQDVRQAVSKVPDYSVFDDINYQVDDHGVATLTGETRTYIVHNSAISRVRDVPGVTRVVDQIEVLPLSPFDDNLRIRAYKLIYGDPALSHYAIMSHPPIRILVKNGDITLKGFVNNELERKLAYARIRTLGDSFKITNELQLDPKPTAVLPNG